MSLALVGPALRGASFISRYGVPLVQQLGVSAGLAGLGALVNASGQKPSSRATPNRRANVGSNSYGGIIGSIPPRTRDNESYRDAELRLSAAARAAGGPSAGGGIGGGNAASFIPYASFGGGGGGTSSGSFGAPGAERAYQQEASRVAQLAAQNPELQRYEKARQLAVAPGASPETVQSAEDIGMQIWRDKYGGTPMGRTGGAVGSFNPLMQSTFGYQAGAAPAQVQAEQATAAPIPVAPGATPYQMGDLGTRATLDSGYDIEEIKKRLLLQAGK